MSDSCYRAGTVPNSVSGMSTNSASGAFRVAEFTPVDWAPAIATGLATGHAHMVKEFDGAISGRAITQFSYAFDHEANVGTYVALESFEGSIDGHTGACNLAHSATSLGTPETGRVDEYFVIVPSSGTGELAGITGTGTLVIEPDGTHRIRLDYKLRARPATPVTM